MLIESAHLESFIEGTPVLTALWPEPGNLQLQGKPGKTGVCAYICVFNLGTLLHWIKWKVS